jgi:hypothetical protein
MSAPATVHSPVVIRALAAAIVLSGALADAQTLRVETFDLTAAAEVHAVVTARCAGCDWGRRGREAAVLTVTVDGGESQDLVLARGAERAEYTVALGPAAPGKHRVSISLDRDATAPGARDVVVEGVRLVVIPESDPQYLAAAYAPMLYARPDALARFSDVPLLLWYEVDPLPTGRRIRYSVVFSNEDGGTPADRLMATWGRLTDIEFAYGVELDAAGRVVSERYQGRDHEILPFRGRRLGHHPLLWVVTENNMLAETGKGRHRIAPAPFPFELASVSREAVMDAHPWTYAVSSEEARREGRVREGAVPGSRVVPDPRRFAYLEACADVKDAALTFAVATRGPDGRFIWHESNGREPKYRIQRSPDHFPNGCFRGAVALPAGTHGTDVAGLRFRAYTREPREGEKPLPPGAATARLTRVNRLFALGADYSPMRSLLAWSGDLPIEVDGAATEVPTSPGW